MPVGICRREIIGFVSRQVDFEWHGMRYQSRLQHLRGAVQ